MLAPDWCAVLEDIQIGMHLKDVMEAWTWMGNIDECFGCCDECCEYWDVSEERGEL